MGGMVDQCVGSLVRTNFGGHHDESAGGRLEKCNTETLCERAVQKDVATHEHLPYPLMRHCTQELHAFVQLALLPIAVKVSQVIGTDTRTKV